LAKTPWLAGAARPQQQHHQQQQRAPELHRRPDGDVGQLTGRLSTGNISQYYAVSTAISVISGRRIAVPSAPNVALDSPKFDADQVAALLDKRDPAMTALEEIAPTMANNDSEQLISALGAVEGS
jgi:hypothetical protein